MNKHEIMKKTVKDNFIIYFSTKTKFIIFTVKMNNYN